MERDKHIDEKDMEMEENEDNYEERLWDVE